MGGQVAHEITNVGPQPRNISPEAQRQMSEVLSKYNPPNARVTAKDGSEAVQLGEQIMNVLENAGWEVDGLDKMILSSGSDQGITVKVPERSEVAETLVILFRQAGLKAKPILNENINHTDIIVNGRPM